MKDLIKLEGYSEKEILDFLKLASQIKKDPHEYTEKLKGKVLVMLFAKPSLRTHLSFDVAMHKLGGHAIYYNLENSPLGKKESIKDGAHVMSRYVDVIMARLYEHTNMVALANHSAVPVINGLDDLFHPCQALGDLLTIKEHFGKLKGLRLTYLGDADANVIHDLMYACAKTGIHLMISCPKKIEFLPNETIFKLAKKFAGKTTLILEHNPKKAVEKAQIIYTDSWMSYHIPESQRKRRIRLLKKYQVNEKLFNISKKAVFMHCLPAERGLEVTDAVIDSKRSIVFQQAENRLWIQMAILLVLLKKE